MQAELVIKQRLVVSETLFVEVVVWKVAPPVRGSAHNFKYRMALVSDGVCILRYDNEAGKGDHKHIGNRETPIVFTDVDSLLDTFFAEVEEWSKKP